MKFKKVLAGLTAAALAVSSLSLVSWAADETVKKSFAEIENSTVTIEGETEFTYAGTWTGGWLKVELPGVPTIDDYVGLTVQFDVDYSEAALSPTDTDSIFELVSQDWSETYLAVTPSDAVFDEANKKMTVSFTFDASLTENGYASDLEAEWPWANWGASMIVKYYAPLTVSNLKVGRVTEETEEPPVDNDDETEENTFTEIEKSTVTIEGETEFTYAGTWTGGWLKVELPGVPTIDDYVGLTVQFDVDYSEAALSPTDTDSIFELVSQDWSETYLAVTPSDAVFDEANKKMTVSFTFDASLVENGYASDLEAEWPWANWGASMIVKNYAPLTVSNLKVGKITESGDENPDDGDDEETTTAIWTGEQVVNTWDDSLTIDASKFADIEKIGTIVVTLKDVAVTDVTDWSDNILMIAHGDTNIADAFVAENAYVINETKDAIHFTSAGDNTFTFTLSEDLLKVLQTDGLIIKGIGFTVTQVDYVASNDGNTPGGNTPGGTTPGGNTPPDDDDDFGSYVPSDSTTTTPAATTAADSKPADTTAADNKPADTTADNKPADDTTANGDDSSSAPAPDAPEDGTPVPAATGSVNGDSNANNEDKNQNTGFALALIPAAAAAAGVVIAKKRK